LITTSSGGMVGDFQFWANLILAAVIYIPRSSGNTPPGISTAPVPSIATPIGVNGFSPLPPQTNGQPASETIYTNGIHPYPGRILDQERAMGR
uniref:Uncharacterized protein n=1 Tax=Laticauda laticaudata TaxID=8630 RepID=A0A8C5RZJ6_LATLA